MEWDWQSRKLKLSVGELSRFSLVPDVDERTGRWRMELGSRWHQVLQERALKENPNWIVESPVAGSLSQQGWQFDLRGRIDLLLQEESVLLREIKTTAKKLPAEEEDLRLTYPHYFHQAMLYAFLLGRSGNFPRAELVFLEIQTGMTQVVALNDADLEALHQHLNRLIEALEERQSHFGRIRSCHVPTPFSEWRAGQPEARDALHAAFDKGKVTLFEAPTGFGKTGLALEAALLKMASGEVNRILLLTSKNTGHHPLIEQLGSFLHSGHGLSIVAVRSRRDLSLDPQLEAQISRHDAMENWIASGLSPTGLLQEGIMGRDELKSLGQRHGVPPWIISRILMPYADIWIADYNYLFDPGVSQVLTSIPTHDPAHTLLIIDEAHNLADRAASSRSHVLDADTMGTLLTELQLARFPASLIRPLDQLVSIVRKQRTCDSLDPPVEADIIGLLRELRDKLSDTGLGEDELSEDSLEWLWNIPWLLDDWDHPHLPMILYAPRKGRIHIACLDASSVIQPIIEEFRHTLMMSATLQPWDSFRKETGIQGTGDDVHQVSGIAPWLEGCFEVMVDARVDTRYRQRDQYIDLTASTIGETASVSRGCTVAFFPSYLYAEKVLERMPFAYPGLRCALQPRDLPLEEQSEFLESALMFEDVLFLVLGSRFSEGIDSLGGKVSQAIVVSPALPEVNSLQKARESQLSANSSMAFRSIYLIPGLRKISQALGRLVRDPDQRARVLLHGKRFMEPEYQDLLPGYLKPVDSIITDEEFAKKWLING